MHLNQMRELLLARDSELGPDVEDYHFALMRGNYLLNICRLDGQEFDVVGLRGRSTLIGATQAGKRQANNHGENTRSQAHCWKSSRIYRFQRSIQIIPIARSSLTSRSSMDVGRKRFHCYSVYARTGTSTNQ
jgi:hypothetical protein